MTCPDADWGGSYQPDLLVRTPPVVLLSPLHHHSTAHMHSCLMPFPSHLACLLQVSVPQFFAGLRARNWTAGKHYQPIAAPWRVQLFSCAYTGGTAWTGLRAVVTEGPTFVPSATAGSAGGKGMQGANNSGGSQMFTASAQKDHLQGRRFWVDMPHPGPPQPLGSKSLADPASAGYNAVLAQLYQAFEQRLPKAARKELATKGYITPGVCGGGVRGRGVREREA